MRKCIERSAQAELFELEVAINYYIVINQYYYKEFKTFLNNKSPLNIVI